MNIHVSMMMSMNKNYVYMWNKCFLSFVSVLFYYILLMRKTMTTMMSILLYFTYFTCKFLGKVILSIFALFFHSNLQLERLMNWVIIWVLFVILSYFTLSSSAKFHEIYIHIFLVSV